MITVDRIQFPQLEAYGRRSRWDTTRCPSHVEKLKCPGPRVFKRSHTYPIQKVGGFDFKAIAVPLRVGFKWRTEVTDIILVP